MFMSEPFVGIDLGGTAIKLGIGDREGNLLSSSSIPTHAHEGPDAVIERMGIAIDQQLQTTGQSPAAIGVGAPGLVDITSGMTKFLPNLPTQWVDVALGEQLRKQFDCPVQVANDARTATLGELKFGLGKVNPNMTMAFFTLGTGVGGGVAIDGKLRLGEFGAAGELGHQTIAPQGPYCGCGNRGCLETLASAPAITSSAIRLMRSGLAPALHELVEGDANRVTVEALTQVAEKEESVRNVIIQAAKYIGIAAANIVAAIHPELIVLGGGVAEIGDLLTQTIKKEIKWRVGMFPTDKIEIRKSSLGVRAGVLGAIALGMSASETQG